MPTETLMMKDSKNTWYGNIPTDWVINKYKFICKISSGDAMSPEDLDDSYEYEVYGGGKLIGFANSYNTQNCILIGRVGANCGCITNISDKCWATDNALILKTSSNKNYMNYLLMASNLNDINESNAQPLITASKVLNFKIPFTCNINEQQAIADFLDEKCEKIDKVIGEIEEQIQVLEDYKKSLITETVTKGLDKNVPMKDSGVDYIGKIPEKWNIIRLKHFSYMKGRIGWQGLSSDEFIDEGPYLVTGTDFKDGEVQWDRCYHMSQKRYNEAWQIQLKIGDLLVTKDGTIGKLAYIHFLPDNASLNSHLLLIRPLKNKYTNKFLYWVLSSQLFKTYYELASTGAIMDSLSQEKIGNFSFAIPEIDEQKQIADYLDKECTKIDKTINDKKEQLETIKEYKKSLIYEYVTGKKRVAC